MRLTVLIVMISVVNSFNLDTKSPYIIKSEAETGYFGYSVALHKNSEGNFLMIGAPTSATPQQGVNQGGTVYKCKVPETMGDPTEPVVCSEQLRVLDDTGNKFVESNDIYGNFDFSYNKTDIYNIQSDEKSHQWLGVTLQSSIDSDYLVGCAHRYETKYLGIASFRDDPPRQLTGKCVLLGKDLDFQESVYEPCRGVESGLTKVGNCQAGTSAHWLDDKLVLGAPGCFEGSGGLYIYDTSDPVIDPGTTDPYKDPKYEDSLPYIGYSTTICDINGDGILDVISGGPRGKLYRGQVVIYRSEQDLAQVQTGQMPFELIGKQMGSYYGASVLCQDMNGDGIDDLVVGAPWYTMYPGQGQSKPDTGRVYFYPGAMSAEGFDEIEFLPADYDLSLLQEISGTDEAETFGYSLSSAGDVNNDGAYDMLVGSPYYNDGEGKVSLFLGGFDGIETTPSQVIVPTKLGILDNLRGFGWSIDGGKDMDYNGISDVLIGSYKSQHAVLLRGIPIIDVMATIAIHGNDATTELDPLGEPTLDVPGGGKVQGINLQACFEYIGASGSEADGAVVATVNFQIKLDSASDTFSQARLYTNYANPSQVYEGQINVDLDNNVKSCTAAIPAYYRGDIGYSSRPVEFSMEAGLEEREVFADRAVLNQQLIHDAIFVLGIASDCPRESGICTTDMAIQAIEVQYDNMDKIPLTIGLVEEITLPVKVLNKGPNTAYGSRLDVEGIPAILPFLPSDECTSTYSDDLKDDERYSIQCSLPSIMVLDESITVPLDFNLTKLQTPQQFDISLVVRVLDPSVMAHDKSGIANFTFNVVNLADLRIKGGSSPLNVNYNNNYGAANKILGYDGPVIRHKYDVSMPDDSVNYKVKDITLSIYWPEKFPGGAWLFPLEVVTFPNMNETDAMVYCDHEDMIVTNWGLMKEFFSESDVIYTNFSCKENKDLCRKITCKLDFLERGGASFKIILTTRLQEYFLNDFGHFNVTSYAELESVEENMTLSKEYTSFSATTFLTSSTTRSQNFLWIIIGAVIAALLILALLIFALYKCKFFKRANLQPEPEPPITYGQLTNAYDDDEGLIPEKT